MPKSTYVCAHRPIVFAPQWWNGFCDRFGCQRSWVLASLKRSRNLYNFRIFRACTPGLCPVQEIFDFHSTLKIRSWAKIFILSFSITSILNKQKWKLKIWIYWCGTVCASVINYMSFLQNNTVCVCPQFDTLLFFFFLALKLNQTRRYFRHTW